VTTPELVKRGWRFDAGWLEATREFYVTAWQAGWGFREHFHDADWDVAHEKARAWAEGEWRAVHDEPEQRDTEPAPAMETAAAE
jgi:hypothetical protein